MVAAGADEDGGLVVDQRSSVYAGFTCNLFQRIHGKEGKAKRGGLAPLAEILNTPMSAYTIVIDTLPVRVNARLNATLLSDF